MNQTVSPNKPEKININKPEINYILLSCCTCKRPKMLNETLESVFNLHLPADIKTEVLIVDNDSEQSAKNTVSAWQNKGITIHYIVELERGIAFARNKVLNEAIKLNSSHILFFDDDEVLTPDCLINHINLYNTNKDAYISSGPTVNKFMENFPKYITRHLVFKQNYTKKTGQQKEDCACGNVFFPVSVAKDYNLRFSTEYKYMGGEDGDFFYRASNLGFNIIWNKEAVIEEMVSKERANIPYILKKCYYNGYAGTLQRIKRFKNKNKKYYYLLRQIPVLILNLLILIPSIFLGPSIFYNILGIIYRTKGKIDACITCKSINFYENIYGR